MKKGKSAKLTIATGIIMAILGVLLAVYGYLSYYGTICSCPIICAGQPTVPCHCYNPFARFCIEIGALLIISGIWWVVLGYRRRSPFVLKRASKP